MNMDKTAFKLFLNYFSNLSNASYISNKMKYRRKLIYFVNFVCKPQNMYKDSEPETFGKTLHESTI